VRLLELDAMAKKIEKAAEKAEKKPEKKPVERKLVAAHEHAPPTSRGPPCHRVTQRDACLRWRAVA